MAEAFIRARRITAGPALQFAAAGVFAGATGLALGTYCFTRYYWGPGILARVWGESVHLVPDRRLAHGGRAVARGDVLHVSHA